MHTSYFAKHLGKPNGVAITVDLPYFAGKCRHYPPLAPSRSLLKEYKAGKVDEEEYTKQYYELLKLRRITPQQALRDLGPDAVLLCYEGSSKFCHRHLAAKWLRKGGIKIEELVPEKHEVSPEKKFMLKWRDGKVADLGKIQSKKFPIVMMAQWFGEDECGVEFKTKHPSCKDEFIVTYKMVRVKGKKDA